MSLQSLTSIHSVDVHAESTTRGSSGGAVRTDTTSATGVKCRIQPLNASESEEFGKDGQRITHRVYFSKNPNLTERNWLAYTDSAGNARTLWVLGVENIDELDRLWAVNCEEKTARDNT